MDFNSPQPQKAQSYSQANKVPPKDIIFSPLNYSPSQKYNFLAQNLNILVNHYDEQPSNQIDLKDEKQKSDIDVNNNDMIRIKSDQLSQIQENQSENTPQTFSNNSHSPSKLVSKFSSMSVDINDINDQRIGALKRGKLFTLTDLESFGGRNKLEIEEILPLTEEVEHRVGQSTLSKMVPKLNSNTHIREYTQQKRKTVQSKTVRSHNVVTIRTPDMIWKQKFFFIMAYVSRMAMKMKQVNIFRHPEMLYETQLNAINDKAAKDITDDSWGQKDNQLTTRLYQDNMNYQQVNKSKKIKYFLKKYRLLRRTIRRFFRPITQKLNSFVENTERTVINEIRKIPCFDSMSWFILLWCNFIFVITVCIVIYLPYEYCFSIERQDISWIILNVIMPCIFFINIVINANTSYFEKGNVINDHVQILSKYIKTNFLIDLISAVSFFIPSDNVLIFIFFLRGFVHRYFVSKQSERFLIYSTLLTYVNVIKLLTQFLLFLHFGSCIWYLIGYYQDTNKSTGWIYYSKLQKDHPFSNSNMDMYLFSTLTILSNISFFQNKYEYIYESREERIFLIGLSIIGIYLFAYLLYEIMKILKLSDKRREEYLKQLKSLSNYMSSHEVEPYLRERSRKYLEFMYSGDQEQQWSTQESLNSLSNYLKQEIIKDVFMKAVKKITLFKKFFSFNRKFLEKLALRSKEISLGPDELIMRQGNIEIPSLYIVTHGEIQLFVEMGSSANIQQKLFKKVLANECFGMYEFFSFNYEVQLSAKSLGVSRMLCITLNDMQELLREFPKEREAFCYLKDLITFKQDLSQIGLSCYSCHQVNHYVLECPYLFYGTQSQKIMKEINKKIKHTIQTFKRSEKRKKINSVFQSYLINHKAQMFQEKYLEAYEGSEQEKYSSDTSIQFLGETSQYSSYGDVESHPLNQSRFDKKSILRVHSGSSKFTARQHKHKDSESQKSYIGSRLDQSKEEKDGTFNRGRPQSVSISKFGRMVKISDLNVGPSEDASELKSAFSWHTRDRKYSLSNNYELNTVNRINSAEFFNNEDSKRIYSQLRRSESEQQLSYENILDRYEQENDSQNQSLRRREKRHSTNKTNKTNKTNRTNKTSKTTITKTLQQLEMDGSLNNSLHQSNSASSNGQIEIDKTQIIKFNLENNMNISPIHNPRKESQNSNSLYNNNNSSNIINTLFNVPSSNNNNNPTSSLNNALNNAMNIGSQPGSVPLTSIISAMMNNNNSSGPSQSNLNQANQEKQVIQNQVVQNSNITSHNINSNNVNINNNNNNNANNNNNNNNNPQINGVFNAQNTGNNSVAHSNSLNQNTVQKDSNNTNTQKQNSNINQQRSLSQQTPSQKFNQQHSHSIYPMEYKLSHRSHQAIENIQSYSASIGTVKSFELYFPQNNVENIIERYNKLQRKKVSRRVRKKRTTQRRETKRKSHIQTFVSKGLIEDIDSKNIRGYQSSIFDEQGMNQSLGSLHMKNSIFNQIKPTSKKEIFSLNTFNLNDNMQQSKNISLAFIPQN